MSSAYESADLILKLFDLRREEVMRKARAWYRKEFHPRSTEDVVSVLRGEHSVYFRMVIATSYCGTCKVLKGGRCYSNATRNMSSFLRWF